MLESEGFSGKKRVAVIWWWPTWSMTAYFIKKFNKTVTDVDIFEPRDFAKDCWAWCNQCWWVVSESLNGKLNADWIFIPKRIIWHRLDSYVLTTPWASEKVSFIRDPWTIISLMRPRFDKFLLNLAVKSGANVIRNKIHDLRKAWNADWFYVSHKENWDAKVTTSSFYDIAVIATGINTKVDKFSILKDCDYKSPDSETAYVTEIPIWKKNVDKFIWNSMHIFLLNIPSILLAAITAKWDYASLVLLWKDLSKESVLNFLSRKEVRKLFPDGFRLNRESRWCSCMPKVNTWLWKYKPVDWLFIVWEAIVSNLYKNWLEAVYETSRKVAEMISENEISANDIKDKYINFCRNKEYDNLVWHVLFKLMSYMHYFPKIASFLANLANKESKLLKDNRHFQLILWDLFTGSRWYIDIVTRVINPIFLFHILKLILIKK